jgi:hypothetical protein
MVFKAIGSALGVGPQKTTRTQTTTPTRPAEVQAASKDLLTRAQSFAAQPFQAYDQQRIAGFTPDELSGFGAARDIAGVSGALSSLTPELTREGIAASRSLAQRLPDVDISEYMSPYTEAVLDPAIRDIEEKAARERLRLGQQSARTGSFGGSRQAIAEGELERGTQRTIGEESARQRAAAYTNALAQFRADQERIPQLYAGALGQLSTGLTQTGQRLGLEVNPLLQTGGAQRALTQAELDFARQQFEEERDYPLRGIEVLRSSLGVSPQALGIGSTGTTTETKPGPGLLQTLGGAVLGSGLGGSLPSLGLSFLSGLGGGGGGALGASEIAQMLTSQANTGGTV